MAMTPRKKLPPRDPVTGRFMKRERTADEQEQQAGKTGIGNLRMLVDLSKKSLQHSLMTNSLLFEIRSLMQTDQSMNKDMIEDQERERRNEFLRDSETREDRERDRRNEGLQTEPDEQQQPNNNTQAASFLSSLLGIVGVGAGVVASGINLGFLKRVVIGGIGAVLLGPQILELTGNILGGILEEMNTPEFISGFVSESFKSIGTGAMIGYILGGRKGLLIGSLVGALFSGISGALESVLGEESSKEISAALQSEEGIGAGTAAALFGAPVVKAITKNKALVKGILGKIVFPITAAVSFLSGFLEEFNRDTSDPLLDTPEMEDGFLQKTLRATRSGLFQVIEDLIVLPLDLIKGLQSWIVEKLGFSETSKAMDSFSFVDVYRNLTGQWIKNPLRVLADIMTFIYNPETGELFGLNFGEIFSFFPSRKEIIDSLIDSLPESLRNLIISDDGISSEEKSKNDKKLDSLPLVNPPISDEEEKRFFEDTIKGMPKLSLSNLERNTSDELSGMPDVNNTTVVIAPTNNNIVNNSKRSTNNMGGGGSSGVNLAAGFSSVYRNLNPLPLNN